MPGARKFTSLLIFLAGSFLTDGAACTIGAAVTCLDGTPCAGNQCCRDGSICPSAAPNFKSCSRAKASDCTSAPWYEGIPSVRVFGPGDAVSAIANQLYSSTDRQQFSDKRYALLLKRGAYVGDIPVGYYTQLLGVSASVADVQVESFSTHDNPLEGNACDNFWRAVEGLTTTTSQRVYWAASQAAPLRRIAVRSELWLSEEGAPHWSSGGFLADSVVHGKLQMGTQQQYCVRNSILAAGSNGKNKNYVFIGSVGDPGSSTDGAVSSVATTSKGRAKPYLRESDGTWSIVLPQEQQNARGMLPVASQSISFEDVFIAKEGDTAAQINAGIVGKRALLLTPGLYGLEAPLQITTTGFVVLGIGYPTLVTQKGNSAVEVLASQVMVASVLLEAGTPTSIGSTDPLLQWAGHDGYGFDIFTRVGAFSYSRWFKPSCLETRADTHVHISGSRIVIDNVWLWHADHDDCSGKSDQSISNYGMVVTGDDVIIYGLKVEHTLNHQVLWTGERGEVYFFQSELPYHATQYPGSGAYAVDRSVKTHTAVGAGVYMVGTPYVVDTAFRLPPSANMKNIFVWAINGRHSQFRSVACTSASGLSDCYFGDRCDDKTCYVYSLHGSTAPEVFNV